MVVWLVVDRRADGIVCSTSCNNEDDVDTDVDNNDDAMENTSELLRLLLLFVRLVP